MFASLRARFTYSQRWIVHFGICLLASAGLVAALSGREKSERVEALSHGHLMLLDGKPVRAS